MDLKKIFIYSLCFICPLFLFGQIKISEFIQGSTIAKQTDNKLYFIDFWATWCGPCLHVSKYLESLQKKYPTDFYIVSLTKENPDLVKKFTKRHRMDLAVAIDFEGQTFNNNNITSLPHGILYNANGKKLWQGHPAELKAYQIAGFLKRNRNKKDINDMFEVQKPGAKTIENTYFPTLDFEYFEFDNNTENDLQIVYNESFIELKGSLRDILAYSNKAYKNQIKIPSNINKQYHMYFKNNTDAFYNMGKNILEGLELDQVNNRVKGEVLIFDVNQPTFWDSKQIDWGNNNEKYLINDSEIQADNVTLKEVAYVLTKLLELPIVINGSQVDNEIHDWQIHYKYFDLMSSSLIESYGIQIEKKISNYPEYTILKKTP